jgi:Cd2+/Zn2+-exporting ATPase
MSRTRCTLKIQGLDCPNEVVPLRAALEGHPGVSSLGFDLVLGTMKVDYEPERVSPEALIERISVRAKMRAEPLATEEAETLPSWWSRNSRWAVAWIAIVTLGAGMVARALGSPSLGFFLLAIVAGAVELGPKAFRSLRQGRMDIHVLMTAAVLGAAVLGQWDEAATVAALFVLSEAIESLTLERARRAVRSLLEIAPETAEVIGDDGRTTVVPASSVQPGTRVRVRAGMRVPVDGTVASGRSSVDQKAITGESVPLSKGPGDEVFAGTVNGDGTLEVNATRLLGDSVVSQIVERVREAQKGRTPIERSIDRFASWYTPAVVAIAILVMLLPPLTGLALGHSVTAAFWRDWFTRGLVMLVIACPCALVIATPVAVVSALAAASRRGILIKGGDYLESFGRLRVLAFDKTGTLTRGTPDVVEIVSAAGNADSDVLRIAAAVGERGGHVLGRAIARHARDLQLAIPDADDYSAVPGLGATATVDQTRYHVGSHRYIDESGQCRTPFHESFGAAESEVGTSVALTASSGPLGWIRLADQPRPEAAAVVADLRRLGIEPVMLTGDNRPTADAIAQLLGITEFRADLLPDDKVAAVAELDSRLGATGMVGDGVNDAPALAASRVSVAIGGISSGAALETADIVLLADDLTGLPWLVRHSRATLRMIHVNIALAIGVKAVVMLLALFGLATLWMAIAADLGTSLVVTANALRLLRSGPGRVSFHQTLTPRVGIKSN